MKNKFLSTLAAVCAIALLQNPISVLAFEGAKLFEDTSSSSETVLEQQSETNSSSNMLDVSSGNDTVAPDVPSSSEDAVEPDSSSSSEDAVKPDSLPSSEDAVESDSSSSSEDVLIPIAPDVPSSSEDAIKPDSSSSEISKEPNAVEPEGESLSDAKLADGAYWDWENSNGTKMRYRENNVDITNKWKFLWDQYYYFGEDGYAVSGTNYIEGVAYNFNENFTLRTGELYWDWGYEDGRLRYIMPKSNQPYKGWLNMGEGAYYYFDKDGVSVKGNQRINDIAYNFNENFTLRTGELYWDWGYDGGRLRYVDSKTGLLHKGWLDLYGYRYYFDSDGVSAKGWQKIGKDYYYFNPDNFIATCGDSRIDGVAYPFTNTGRLMAGQLYWDWAYNGGRLRFIVPGTHEPYKGWLDMGGGAYYYFDEKGLSVSGSQRINDAAYNFNENFTLRTGELYWDWAYDGGRLRFIVPGTHEPYKGWLNMGGGVYYYFDKNGLSVTGTQKIDGNTYDFNPNFTLRMGELYWDWTYDGGRLRYINPTTREPQKGWLNLYGSRYYFNQDGVTVKGWQKIDNDYYYFNPDNFVASSGEIRIDNTAYAFTNDGRLITGQLYWDWAYNGGRLRFIVPGTHEPYKGWLDMGGGAYYYFNENGLSVAGGQRIDGAAYNFNENFTMRTGELYWDWAYDGGRLRYVNPTTGKLHKGWLDIDGARYYFDQDGLSVKGTVVIDGREYTFDDHFRLVNYNQTIAIDVSYHQGIIDWQAVANSGVKYAIIRSVGWNKSLGTVGGIDSMFDYNVREAKKYGIKVGTYIYTYAKTENEVLQEVNAFLTAMQRLENDGYRLDLPVFVDQEDRSLLEGLTNQDRTNLLRYEMVLLHQKGYYPGMYMSTFWSQNNVDAEQLYSEGYDMWIADYRTNVQNPVWIGRCALWQYSSKGRVPGIKTDVDMNYIYKDYTGLIQGSNNTGSDSTATFQVRNENSGGAIVEDTMLNLLAAIVNNEVGSGLGLSGADRMKLYQSQAIAAHSWLLYSYGNNDGIPSVGLNYGGNYNLIREQIQSVQDTILTYQDKPALTVYGSCNNGRTNSAGDYWNQELPYLPAGIESKYDREMAPQFFPTVSRPRTSAEVASELKRKHGIDTSKCPNPAQWFVINGRNAGNYITTLNICGTTIKGGTLNDNFSPIRSSDFTVEYDAQNDRFTFKSYGNGHGIGMSQLGAAGYIAKENWGYEQVLRHYYPNTVFSKITH